MDLEWLKKRAKAVHRAGTGKLADAQLAVAREHGFASWRALKTYIEAERVTPIGAVSEADAAAFLRLVGDGDVDRVKARLGAEPALVNAVGPHPFWGGRPSPLHVAIETNRPEMVRLLLRAGADVNARGEEYSHWTPLMAALADGRERSKRALIRRGARVGLAEALMMGDDKRALKILQRGPRELAGPAPNDGSWLALARTPAAIDRLLALGASTTKQDRWGATPIEAMSRQGKKGTPLVRHLAARGVAVDAAAFARIGDRRTLARVIAATPAVVREPDVVKSAVDFAHHELVGWLLDQGADPDARSTNRTSHDTCLHSAAWNGDLKMIELLLARGANPRLLDDDHQGTPQGWAEVSLRVTNNPKCTACAERLRLATE